MGVLAMGRSKHRALAVSAAIQRFPFRRLGIVALAALVLAPAAGAAGRSAAWKTELKSGKKPLASLWEAMLEGGAARDEAVCFYKSNAAALLPRICFTGDVARISYAWVDNDSEWAAVPKEGVECRLPAIWKGQPFEASFLFRQENPSYAREFSRRRMEIRVYPFAGDIDVAIPEIPRIAPEALKNRWNEWNELDYTRLFAELEEANDDTDKAIGEVARDFYAERDDLHPDVEIVSEEGDFSVIQNGATGRPMKASPGSPGKLGRIPGIRLGETKKVDFLLYRTCEDPSCTNCSPPQKFSVDVAWNSQTKKVRVSATNLPPFWADPQVELPASLTVLADPQPCGVFMRRIGVSGEGACEVLKNKDPKTGREVWAVAVAPHDGKRKELVIRYPAKYEDAVLHFQRKMARGERFREDEWANLPPLREKAGAKVAQGGAEAREEAPLSPPPIPAPEQDGCNALFQRIVKKTNAAKNQIAEGGTGDPQFGRWLESEWKNDAESIKKNFLGTYGEIAMGLVNHLRRPADDEGCAACREIHAAILKKAAGADAAAWKDDDIFAALRDWVASHPGGKCHGTVPGGEKK